jgi:hypothetical protein
MGPIFLFFIDRFLRMVQSRRQVAGVSARVLPSGLVELKIPKQPGMYDFILIMNTSAPNSFYYIPLSHGLLVRFSKTRSEHT